MRKPRRLKSADSEDEGEPRNSLRGVFIPRRARKGNRQAVRLAVRVFGPAIGAVSALLAFDHAAADLDRLRPPCLRLRQVQLEDAVLEVRGRLLGVERGGEGEGAGEHSVAGLPPQPVLVLLPGLLLRLAPDGDGVTVDLDLDVVRLQAWQSSFDLE